MAALPLGKTSKSTLKSVKYRKRGSDTTTNIGIMETPGIGQIGDIDADTVHLLRIILSRIKDYETLRVCESCSYKYSFWFNCFCFEVG